MNKIFNNICICISSNPLISTLVGGLILLLLAIYINGILEHGKENRPLEKVDQEIKPLQKFTSITILNPSTKPYKLLEARFRIKKREEPGYVQLAAVIDTIYISFTSDDYDSKTETYKKSINNEQIEDGKLATINVSIIDPQYNHWAFYGELTITYTGDNSPYKEDNFPIQVTFSKERIQDTKPNDKTPNPRPRSLEFRHN